MKKLILSLAMVSVTVAFAQKKEINAAFKAAESGDIAAAKTSVAAAEAVMGGNTSSVEPALLEKYYYAKGLSLLKSGNTAEGAAQLAKIADLKNDKFSPTLTSKIGEALNPSIQAANKDAMDAYNAKNYVAAGPKFREVYDLLKATGQNNKLYLYYSAITYALSPEKEKAIATYNELINSNYTGVETTYTAKNKKNGQVESLDKATWDLMKRSDDYLDFKTETTKSVEPELYETNVALLNDLARYDEAIALSDKGLAKFPSNAKLSELKGIAYFKSGKTDQFMESLKEAVAKNPNDKTSWYNLGVVASKDTSKIGEAEGYFKKSLEVDPNYIPSLQAIFYNVYMGDDSKVIDSANEAKKAGKTDLFNKILDERRARLAKGLPYIEKWYSLEPNNIEVVSLLKGLYQSTRNDAKFQEMKAKEAALQASGAK